MNLFTYGSLMYPQIWRRVVRGRYHSQPAVLEGYARWCIAGEDYPGLWPAAGGRLEGVLYRNIRHGDWLRLDAFEGAEYWRETVRLQTLSGVVTAVVYRTRPRWRCRLTNSTWAPAGFESAGLKRLLSTLQVLSPGN